MDNPPPYLNVVLLLTMLATVGGTTLATQLAARRIHHLGELIATVAMTLLLFVFAEVTPKTFAIQQTDRVALRVAPLVVALARLFGPVAKALLKVANVIMPGKGLPQGPYVQAREPLPSTPLERKAFAEDFEVGAEAMGRRTFIARLFGLALGALGVAAILPIRSLGPSPGRSLFVTEWRRGSRVVKANNQPVKVADLNVGSVVTVFPEGHPGSADSQTVLIRVRLHGLHISSDRLLELADQLGQRQP